VAAVEQATTGTLSYIEGGKFAALWRRPMRVLDFAAAGNATGAQERGIA